MYNIDDVLKRFLLVLTPILVKIEKYMNSPNIELLEEISNDFINLGNIFYNELASHSHRILSVIALDAGLKIREKYRDRMNDDLNMGDINYMKDIYDIFKKIAEKIESGEYLRYLNMMAEKKTNS